MNINFSNKADGFLYRNSSSTAVDVLLSIGRVLVDEAFCTDKPESIYGPEESYRITITVELDS